MSKLKNYTVHFMSAYETWENVKAKSQKEAIKKCEIPDEFDCNEPFTFIAVEEDDEDFS